MPLRQPVVAGRFYTADPRTLRSEITEFLGSPKEKITPLMVMLPHAGHVYCGSIVGETLSRVRLPQTVFLLGPNHTGRGVPLSVWPEGRWFTPLGPVEVDGDLADAAIRAGAGFQVDTEAHRLEHSLEVLLPFLQVHTPGIRIIPMIIAAPDPLLKSAGEVLAGLIRAEKAAGRSVGLMVSTDMNHFADQQTTLDKDTLALDRFLALDPEGLFRTVRDNDISMCGVGPATLALYASLALGARTAELVRHGTSGDITGDTRQVVGYAGAWIGV